MYIDTVGEELLNIFISTSLTNGEWPQRNYSVIFNLLIVMFWYINCNRMFLNFWWSNLWLFSNMHNDTGVLPKSLMNNQLSMLYWSICLPALIKFKIIFNCKSSCCFQSLSCWLSNKIDDVDWLKRGGLPWWEEIQSRNLQVNDWQCPWGLIRSCDRVLGFALWEMRRKVICLNLHLHCPTTNSFFLFYAVDGILDLDCLNI